MLTSITLNDQINKELPFNKINDLGYINILFGQNKVHKMKLLNIIKNREFEAESNTDMMVKYFRSNDIDALEVFDKLTAFLHGLKTIPIDKKIIVLIDEINEDVPLSDVKRLSAHIKTLVITRKIQFFISTNHFHFVHKSRNVIDIDDSEHTIIESRIQYLDMLRYHSNHKNATVYSYVAVLTRDIYYKGFFDVHFPDLQGCTTSGSAIHDNLYNKIKDILRKYIIEELRQGKTLPTPTNIDQIRTSKGQGLMNIEVRI